MGHATDFLIAKNKDEIMEKAIDFACLNTDRRENPSGSYHNRLDILDSVVYADWDEAVEKAEELRKLRENYNDFAIPFYSLIKKEPTKAILDLDRRIEERREKRKEYEEKTAVYNLKANFIGCKDCGSKINREYLKRGNRCPVCGKDLRSDYILEKIEKDSEKILELYKKRQELEKKNSKRGEINWLVKVEVHC